MRRLPWVRRSALVVALGAADVTLGIGLAAAAAPASVLHDAPRHRATSSEPAVRRQGWPRRRPARL